MARLSSTARAARQDDELDVDYSERDGFLTGKAAAIADWRFRKERNDPEFRRLIWRLQAKKYWAAKDPDRKAAIVAYREKWREEHRELHNAYSRKAKRKRRSNPEIRAAEIAEKRAKRAVGRQQRRAATVYTCQVCGTQWSPLGRLPSRPPSYCPNGAACRSKANYQRGKADGKPWALRNEAAIREARSEVSAHSHVFEGQRSLTSETGGER